MSHEEEKNEKKERVFDLFWSLEEQQTILGLLKGRKKKMKEQAINKNKLGQLDKDELEDIIIKACKSKFAKDVIKPLVLNRLNKAIRYFDKK